MSNLRVCLWTFFALHDMDGARYFIGMCVCGDGGDGCGLSRMCAVEGLQINL
jgi:hypothetical protein